MDVAVGVESYDVADTIVPGAIGAAVDLMFRVTGGARSTPTKILQSRNTLRSIHGTRQPQRRLMPYRLVRSSGANTTVRIAIVATGPTGLCTFEVPLVSTLASAINLFERGDRGGIGAPFSPETTSRSMLANIASIELPPVVTSYLDWLQDQPPELLQTYGLDLDDRDNHQFSLRLLLGKHFRVQSLTLIVLGHHRLHRHRRDDYHVHGCGQTQAPMDVIQHKCDPPPTALKVRLTNQHQGAEQWHANNKIRLSRAREARRSSAAALR